MRTTFVDHVYFRYQYLHTVCLLTYFNFSLPTEVKNHNTAYCVAVYQQTRFLTCFEFAGPRYHYKLNTHSVYNNFRDQQIHILFQITVCLNLMGTKHHCNFKTIHKSLLALLNTNFDRCRRSVDFFFIDWSICHGRYRRSMPIHLLKTTVDIDGWCRFT